MHTFHTSLLALLAGTALARSHQEVTHLKPITKGKGLQARADEAAVAPTTSVNLDYGLDSEPMVHVELEMQIPTVLLEDVASIKNVSCSSGSLSVFFTTSDGFEAAVATWVGKGDLVFFTNHLGGCDAEVERGIFKVNKVSGDKETLTILAQAEKKDVASTAGKFES